MADAIHRFDLSGQAFKRNPFPTLTAMRNAGPVLPSRIPIIGRVSLVTTYAGAEHMLKGSDSFALDHSRVGRSRAAGMRRWFPKGLRLLAENMLTKDDPEHCRLRKLVDGAFHRSEIETLRPRIEATTDDLLDGLAASDDRDLVAHVARDLPLAVICEMLGLPQQDRPVFTCWMSAMSTISSAWGIVGMLPAIGKMNRYLRRKFDERRAEPRDDLISALVHAEDAGDRLSDEELLAMCFLLFVAGHETTTHLISGGVLALLQNPGQLEQLRAQPDLISTAVDELLRYVSPVQITKPRYAIQDLEIEGVTVRKGEALMAVLASANADPALFDMPQTLDIGRQKNRHLAFGGGPHFCLGAWLAKTEMETLLQRLLDRTPTFELAVPEVNLRWTKRIGLRALTGLPLKF